MIRINLLPVREERRRADVRQFAVLFATVVVGSLAVAGLFHWKISSDLGSARDEIARTRAEVDRFAPQLEKVEQYRKAKAQIEQKLDVIETLEKRRAGPVRVLDELATHAPDRLWVTRIEAAGGRITIRGMSLDNELVAQFITALNGSAYFGQVELRQTEAAQKDGYKLNQFELTAAVKTPGTARPEDPGTKASGQTAAALAAPVGTGR